MGWQDKKSSQIFISGLFDFETPKFDPAKKVVFCKKKLLGWPNRTKLHFCAFWSRSFRQIEMTQMLLDNKEIEADTQYTLCTQVFFNLKWTTASFDLPPEGSA